MCKNILRVKKGTYAAHNKSLKLGTDQLGEIATCRAVQSAGCGACCKDQGSLQTAEQSLSLRGARCHTALPITQGMNDVWDRTRGLVVPSLKIRSPVRLW